MTPVSFLDAFPRLHEVRPFMFLGPDLAWVTPFSWSDDELVFRFCQIVLERQLEAGVQNIEWLSEIADAAIIDLNLHLGRLDEVNDRRDYRAILFFRMLITVIPMKATLAHGQRGPCYDWAQRGLSTQYDPTRRFNPGYFFMPFWEEGDPQIGLLWMEKLPEWCLPFYLNARDLGSPDEAEAAFFAQDCWDICSRFFDGVSAGHPTAAANLVSALSSIASWAIMADQSQVETWVERLVEIWNGQKVPRRVRPTLASVFITRANPMTGRSIRSWGEEILREYSDVLREHERLMFLIATVDSREQWRTLRAAILCEIAGLVEDANSAGVHGADRIAARESRIDLVKPLIRTLTDAQDLSGVMDVLTAWYTEPNRERCDDNVIFVNPAYRDGVAVLWPGGAWINARTASTGHEIVLDALNEVLGIETDPAFGAFIDEAREGMPDYSKGALVEKAMAAYYRLSEVKSGFKVMTPPRSLVVFPSVADPLQALVGRDLELTLPLEVSLAEPQRYRTVRRISIWAGQTYYTDYEVEAVKEFGALNGWEASAFDATKGDAEDFRRFYEQPDADVLWVAGHGEFIAHRPNESGIILNSQPADGDQTGGRCELVLPMQAAAGFAIPQRGRRLLVLNTCSGATTQGMSGMARIGLAQSLVQPAQAVIGHLWPASSGLGLAFGMLLASNLIDDDIEGAFTRTAVELRKPAEIAALLTARLGAPPNGLFRIERDSADIRSIMAWGCPVLLT